MSVRFLYICGCMYVYTLSCICDTQLKAFFFTWLCVSFSRFSVVCLVSSTYRVCIQNVHVCCVFGVTQPCGIGTSCVRSLASCFRMLDFVVCVLGKKKKKKGKNKLYDFLSSFVFHFIIKSCFKRRTRMF